MTTLAKTFSPGVSIRPITTRPIAESAALLSHLHERGWHARRHLGRRQTAPCTRSHHRGARDRGPDRGRRDAGETAVHTSNAHWTAPARTKFVSDATQGSFLGTS